MPEAQTKEANDPFPVPDDYPERAAFTRGLSFLRDDWPFSVPELPRGNIVPAATDATHGRSQVFLQGNWTNYPTYCLIAWPIQANKTHRTSLGTLKKVLVACHLMLCESMESANKHYQSRLQESFRIFRQACSGKHDALLGLLPSKNISLEDYAAAVDQMFATASSDPTLQALKRCLEGAIGGRGGHTRLVGRIASGEIVGRRERVVQEAEVHGRLFQSQEQINSNNVSATLRLAADESGSGAVHYQSQRPIVPAEGESAYQAVRAAKGRKASIVRLNQLHPFGWERLSLFDIRAWFVALEGICARVEVRSDITPAELQALIALMFWTGRNIDEACLFRAVSDYTCLPRSTIREHGYIVLEPVVAVMPRYRAEGAKDVSSSWAAYVHESADRVFLPLPSAARRQIEPWLTERAPIGSKGVRLFRAKPSDYEAAVRNTLSILRKETGARVTPIRSVRQLPIAIANHCGDRIVAATTMAVPVGSQTLAGAYYYSSTQTNLAKTYWKSAAALSDDLLPPKHLEAMPELPRGAITNRVGSNVYPDDGAKFGQDIGFYRYFVEDLLNALKYARTRSHRPEFTVAFHNAYTAYCVALLAAVTGYRAVKNPLEDIHALDAVTGWLVISDKDYSDHRNARLTWAPPLLAQQLEAYAVYRAMIVRVLSLEDAVPGFFFFLDDARHCKPVKPHSLAAAVNWTNKLPLNANRHFLRTKLAERSVPGEIIDAYMGHWDLGEEPYGPYSALSPREFKQSIQPAINAILSAHGWRLEHGVDPMIVRPGVSVYSQPIVSQKPVADKPDSNVRISRDRDRARLDETLKRLQPSLLHRQPKLTLADEDIDAVFDVIRSDLRFHDWRHVHNTLVRRLEQGVSDLEWEVKIPAPVVVLNRPMAPFTPNGFYALADLRKLEAAFLLCLRELAPDSSDIDVIVASYANPSQRLRRKTDLATLLVGQILFSAARYGGLLSRKSIEALVSQIASGGMAIRGRLVFDLEVGGQTIRWYADSLTCVLILRYRAVAESTGVSLRSQSIDHALRAFVRALAGNQHRLENVQAFLQAAAVAWRLTQPAFLYRWAESTTTSVSWSKDSEMRVRFDRRLKHQAARKPRDDDELNNEANFQIRPRAHIASPKEVRHDLNRAYREFYRCLDTKRGTSWRGQISRQVATWIEENSQRVGLVPVLMAQWIIAITLGNCRTHTAVGAASSLRTYVSRIGREIFIASKSFPDEASADVGPWQALYKAAVEAKQGPDARRTAAAECQNFHNFVIRHLDVPPLAVGEAVGVGPISATVSVNANYITPNEFERAADWLAEAGQRDRRFETAHQALTVAYWSGLRIGELTGLRLSDVQIAWGAGGSPKRVELLVRAHDQRALKSSTSRRRVPISCLMPTARLKSFLQFFREREQRCEGLSHANSAFLFAISGLSDVMPDHEEIRGLVTNVLRQITGDDSIVFHHLRHSAANNWLLALMARTDSDPIWGLFPEPPKPLLDVARRINRGLMINANRRRGILHAVANLLGHGDPKITLQSYIHVLPWISAVHTEMAGEPETYIGLERTVALDASLLSKSMNATRSWRSRNKEDPNIQGLANYWLNKFAARLAPDAYQNTGPSESIESLRIALPSRPLPSPYSLYQIALRTYQFELADGFDNSNARLTRIAQRCGEPLWLVTSLLKLMRDRGDKPAGRRVADSRVPHNNRFETKRKKYLRGHGDALLTTLSQGPELAGLMPAPPRTKADLNNCSRIWKGLSDLLEETGQWKAAVEGQTSSTANQQSRDLLARGLDAFLERSNSSEHAMKFFHSDLQAARDYVALVSKVYPHNRILVELKRPPSLSKAKARADARKDLGLHDVNCIVVEPTVKSYPKWPYGLSAVRLLSEPYDKNGKPPRASYGAWFGLYAFALLYNAILD